MKERFNRLIQQLDVQENTIKRYINIVVFEVENVTQSLELLQLNYNNSSCLKTALIAAFGQLRVQQNITKRDISKVVF